MKSSVPPETQTLPARKRASVRTSIGEQATQLFFQKGYAATTVDDIAAASGIGRRTFFRYFKSKEDVLLWGFDQFAYTVIELLKHRPKSEQPLAAMKNAVLGASVFFGGQPTEAIAVLKLVERTPALYNQQLAQQDRWADWFASALRQRKKWADKSMVPELASALALQAMRLGTRRWIADPSISLTEHVSRALSAMEKLLKPARR
jgi:AcrR family transcriptional regulator